MKPGLSAALLATLPLILSTASASAFSATFQWCSGSPAFTLRGVPKETAKIDFQMTDLDKPDYRHGGGTVAYHGQSSIPCDAFSGSFNGPSPPYGQTHTYQFDIKALSSSGQTLATTTARRRFPSK